MNFADISKKLTNGAVLVLVFTILGGLLATGLAFVLPQQYETSFRLLIVQKYNGNVDAFTIARSSEQIAGILKEVVYSDHFISRVSAIDSHISFDNLPTDHDKKIKAWQRKVSITVIGETGIMAFKVYDTDKATSERIAKAINTIMTINPDLYYGGNENITVRTIDYPFVNGKPAKPGKVSGAILGLIVGLLAGVLVAVVVPESFDLRFGKDEKKKIGKSAAAAKEATTKEEKPMNLVEKTAAKEYAKHSDEMSKSQEKLGQLQKQFPLDDLDLPA